MGIGGRGEQAQRQQAQREAEAGVLYNEIPGYPVTFKLWGPRKARSVFALVCTCVCFWSGVERESRGARGRGPARVWVRFTSRVRRER